MNVSWQPSQCRPACASQAMFLKRDKGTCYVLSFCTTQQGDASLDSELRQELQGVSKWCGDPCLTIGGNLFEEIYWRKYIKAASSPRQVVNWMNHARSCPNHSDWLGRYSCFFLDFKPISVFFFFFLGGEHLGLKVRLTHRGSSLSQEWLRELVSLVDWELVDSDGLHPTKVSKD